MSSPDPLVSVIIPVVRWPGAKLCVAAVEAHSGLPPEQVEILVEEDTEQIGCPRMVERLTAKARGQMVCFLADDTVPKPGFLAEALKVMEGLPGGWGLVALNDGIHNGRLATHWLADKRLLDLTGGYFFNPAYHHNFCDNELTEIARDAGRYAYAPLAVIDHYHPIKGGQDDEHYQRARARYLEDQTTFWRRKRARAGFRLGIGLPITDHQVPTPFMLSYVTMRKPDHVLLVPSVPTGGYARSIAAARESLVEQALWHGCTHLVMMDTDQTYLPDCLERLLAHMEAGRQVVGVRVHRRWPPFDVIMMRGELGRYKHVPDAECFSGDLVEVDATGTGCLIFDTSVFLDQARPWFAFGETPDGKPAGEDILLCSRLRQAGVQIFVDTSIEVGHLTTHEISRGTYEIFKKLNKVQWAPPNEE